MTVGRASVASLSYQRVGLRRLGRKTLPRSLDTTRTKGYKSRTTTSPKAMEGTFGAYTCLRMCIHAGISLFFDMDSVIQNSIQL